MARRRPALALRVAMYAALVLPLPALTSCGLETVTYYSPPYFNYGGNVITLTHNASNSLNFLGYDIYYRAYGTFADAESARISIENAANLTTSTPEGVLSQMTSLGFKKIYLYSNPSVPPTPLFSGATTYTIQTTFASISTNWYYVTTDPSVHTQIIRAIGNTTVSYDSFNYQYWPGDSDYASATAVVAGYPVFIVAFALAYGFDFTKLTPIYSFPASLYQEVGGSSGYTLPTIP